MAQAMRPERTPVIVDPIEADYPSTSDKRSAAIVIEG